MRCGLSRMNIAKPALAPSFAHLVQLHLRSSQHIAEVERVITVAVEIGPYLQIDRREAVHHRAIPQLGKSNLCPLKVAGCGRS